MRTLGIDYGDSRVGLAISDAIGITAQGLETIHHKGNDKLVLKRLDEIMEKYEIDTIVVCENCVQTGEIDSKTLYEIAKYNCVYVDEKVFNNITDVQNPQGLLAVVDKNCKEQQIKYDEDAIVILDGIQDPGNLGTILRTIDSVRIITSCSIQKNRRYI